MFSPLRFLAKSRRQATRTRRLAVESLERRELFAIEPFTIAVLPDTQFYAQSYPETFDAQTQWIVDNREEENIVFVTHEGDIVQSAETAANRNELQWTRADRSMDILDGDLTQNPNGLIPYSVAIGNHDYGRTSDKSTGSSRYRQFFGAQRYEGRTWYGGDSASGLSHYQIFAAGDWQFLHLALEWEPGNAELAWAQGVIDDHPGLPTIITTHSYVNDSTRGRTTTSTNTGPSNSGEEVFQKLVRPNAQIFMVLNGHFSGEYHQTSINAAGKPVYEMVADYQSRVDGGQGYLRLITVDPDADRIRVRTYSPVLNQFETDSNSQFTFTVDLSARFGPGNLVAATDPNVQTTTFRAGELGYLGVEDAQVKQGTASTAYGRSLVNVLVDGATPGERTASHALIAFQNLVGSGAQQIPAGARVLSAELVLNTTNAGDGGTLHRMLKDWTGGSTWNYLGNGITADGIEAVQAFTAQVGSSSRSPNVPEGTTVINVTTDVQAWANGSANRGWAILPWAGSTDGWGFSPSEVGNVNFRPQLKVEWIPAPTAEISTFVEGANSYDGTVDTTLALNAPTSRQDANSLVTVDGPTDNTTRVGLMKFDEIFGTAASQIPAGAQILWAELYLTTPSGVSNAEGAGAKLHRVLKPWSSSATWSNSFGGNGIQTNNSEAATVAELNTGVQTIGSSGFDVTDSLRRWKSGEANHGWMFQFNTSDAWSFGSSEQESLLLRPKLIVAWLPA
ncbi:DNRLRE domain-containing protein [Anatilimnocola sp. NA78]|uniref:DNRLRE domain-containing protein n=1 Tax=Anatilimnocola sp. NA78 TaxID=3415683 RepID=UPI003CE51009